MTKEQELQALDTACETILRRFIDEYFDKDTEYFDVGDDKLGVWCIEYNYFFSISDITTALRHNIPEDVLFSWYEHTTDIDIETLEPKNRYISLTTYAKKL